MRKKPKGCSVPTDTAPGRLNELVAAYAGQNVSDVHAHPGQALRISRYDRLYEDRAVPAPTAAEIETWINAATGKTADELLSGTGHACAPLETGTVRLRCTFRRDVTGVSASFRLIPSEIPTLEDLGVQDSIRNLIHARSGLVIVEGGTGHGKSTLNAALLRGIRETYPKHIYIVEDPIEFIHPAEGNNSVIQREVGVHVSDYPSAVEDALRSRPHVIMIGELINAETAHAALRAATTGHLVFTTAHAGSATEAVEGFIGQFPASEQPMIRTRMAQSLRAIIAQRLVPSTDQKLVAAREILINSVNFASLIRNADEHLIHGQLTSAPGCQSLEDDLAALAAAGKITEAQGLAEAVIPAAYTANLQALRRMGAAA